MWEEGAVHLALSRPALVDILCKMWKTYRDWMQEEGWYALASSDVWKNSVD